MKRLSLIALAAVGVIGLSACASDDGTDTSAPEEVASEESASDPTGAEDTGAEDTAQEEDAVETIAVTAQEMSFDGIPETLPAGTIRIDFENVGQARHDLVVEELGDEQVIPVIDAGASQSATVTLDPGTYTFYCSVGGHRAMGMEATVTVE
ncbi:cupredoxin domain-containing protein [Nocardiopsis lucentensis]|uniref:cupredoxin domain-containing protein n=1 Tax=Nocardiopsis lucentensis TaxID=53441 RepID=UPI00034B259C|nr:cupredoxin domain-containing protein [Nocardiopsis lucentensis]